MASESKHCSDRVTLKQNSYSILVKFHEFLGKIMFKRRYLFWNFKYPFVQFPGCHFFQRIHQKKRVFAHRLTSKTQQLNPTPPLPPTLFFGVNASCRGRKGMSIVGSSRSFFSTPFLPPRCCHWRGIDTLGFVMLM